MKPLNFSQFIQNRIANIESLDSFVFVAAVGIGPWIAPVSGAVIFGYSLYEWLPQGMGDFKLITAAAAAVGLIFAGAVSSHNAIASGGSRAWRMVYGYIMLEITGLWAMTVGWDVKIAGTVAALLTLIVYLGRASLKSLNLAQAETKETETIKRDFQMEQARANADHRRAMEADAARLKHAEKLARIEVKNNEPFMSRPNDTVLNRPNDTVKLKKQVRLNRIMDLLEDHTQPEIASILGVSLSTIKRDIKQLNGNLDTN